MASVTPRGYRQPSGPPDLVRLYLDEIGAHALLDPVDETRLAKLIERGQAASRALGGEPPPDPACRAALRSEVRAGLLARRAFIEANLRLVVSIAARYRRSDADLADLIQEGNIALMRAVERFDWRRGHRFSTYATWWVRKAVAEAAGESSAALRVPRRRRDQARAMTADATQMEQQLGRRPSRAEVAEQQGIGRADMDALAIALSPRVSLSTPVDERGTELSELLADEATNTERDVAASLLSGELAAVLDGLSPMAARVLRLRYGLDGEEPHSIREVAAALALSAERIRQIEVRALLRLRHRLKDLGWAS